MTDLPPPPPPPASFGGPAPAPPAGFLPPEGSAFATGSGGVPGQPAAFAMPAASWGSRAGALMLDLLVQLFLVAAVAVLVAVVTGGESFTFESEDADGDPTTETLPYWAAWAIGVMFVLVFTYPWMMMGIMRGRTPGRRLVGIRVVNYDGTSVGFGRAFLREAIAKGMLGLFSFPILLSYLWPLWDAHQRALHDLIVSTRVVRDEGDTLTDAFDSSGMTYQPPTAPVAPTPTASAHHSPDSDDLAGKIGLDG